jgi:hypothetical protein
VKITVREVLEMLHALGQLDSYQNGAEKPTLYRYGGDVRLKIAMARRKLRAVQEDYQEARNQMIMEVTDGIGALPALGPQSTKDDFAKNLEFSNRERDMLKAEIEVDIEPVPLAGFNLDENPIPPTVLDFLGDFIGVTQ